MARKTKKICLVCGKEFDGTSGAITCSGACRTWLTRLRQKNKKPDYWLMAKGKGQKIPTFEYSPKKEKSPERPLGAKIDYKSPDEHSYDAPPLNAAIFDEMGQCSPPPPLMTKEQIFAHNFKIEQQIVKERDRKCPMGQHPKQFKLQQEMIIDELQKQIIHT